MLAKSDDVTIVNADFFSEKKESLCQLVDHAAPGQPRS